MPKGRRSGKIGNKISPSPESLNDGGSNSPESYGNVAGLAMRHVVVCGNVWNYEWRTNPPPQTRSAYEGMAISGTSDQYVASAYRIATPNESWHAIVGRVESPDNTARFSGRLVTPEEADYIKYARKLVDFGGEAPLIMAASRHPDSALEALTMDVMAGLVFTRNGLSLHGPPEIGGINLAYADWPHTAVYSSDRSPGLVATLHADMPRRRVVSHFVVVEPGRGEDAYEIAKRHRSGMEFAEGTIQLEMLRDRHPTISKPDETVPLATEETALSQRIGPILAGLALHYHPQ